MSYVLQKDLSQLIKGFTKAELEFKVDFLNALSFELKQLNKSFPYFKSFAFLVRSSYIEENDSYQPPTLENVSLKIDGSAFLDTNFWFSEQWLTDEMDLGNAEIFPSLFRLARSKDILLDVYFQSYLFELNQNISIQPSSIARIVADYAGCSNCNLIINCESGSIEAGEWEW